MTTLNNQDEIYLFNTQKPIANLCDTDLEQKDFREIVLGAKKEDGEQDLWLKLLDLATDLAKKRANEHDQNWHNLYLGRSKTFTKGKSPQKHNVVVPLIPRCYATPDRDPAQAVEVPEGWLYIIRKFQSPQGQAIELWRELKSDGLGNYSDVNLKRFKGKDQRTATGQPGFRIIVPYCIDKQVHDLWIAYSEVQWSWNRVQSLKKDTDLRNRRMHKLDLSDCLNSFANSNYTAPPLQGEQKNKPEITSTFGSIPPGNPQPAPGTATKSDAENPKEDLPFFNLDEVLVRGVRNTAELYNLISAPDPDSKSLAKSFKEAIPVVYLDNPIGIGRRLAAEYQQQWQEMETLLNDLRSIPERISHPSFVAPESLNDDLQKRFGVDRWFEAAALANRYFYSKISKVIPPGVKNIPAYEKRLTEIEEQFLAYRNKIDKPTIDAALRVQQRNAIRARLVQARKQLVDFLENELASIAPDADKEKAQDPPLVQALDDYFTLTPLAQQERKRNPNDAIGDKSIPCWRDNYFDGWGAVSDLLTLLGKHEYSLDADLEANPPDGWKWRRNDPGFELLRKLADPEGGYPLHNRLFPKAAADSSLAIDAAKSVDTGTDFKTQHFDNFRELSRRDDDICKGVNLFGTNFNELMAMRNKNDPAYEKSLERAQHSLLRLIEGAFQLEFKEKERSLAELITEAEKEQIEDKNSRAPLFKTFEKSVCFLKTSIDASKEFPESAKPGSDPLTRTYAQMVTVVNKSRAVNLLRDLGDNRSVTSGLAGFLGLVKIYNFSQTLKAFTKNRNDERNWEMFAPLASSILKLPTAIKDVRGLVEKMAGKEAVSNTPQVVQRGLREKGVTQAAKKATSIEILEKFSKKAVFLASLIDLEISLASFIDNLAENDDAAIADAIGLSGITVGLLSTFVTIPGAGWIVGLTALATLLAKTFLFKEDTPVETWIDNGPFARGKESHDIYTYERTTDIRRVRNAQGQWVEKACTVYRYYNDSLYVDADGNLLDVGRPANHWANFPLFKGDRQGQVFLMAGKHPKAKKDIHIGAIGHPFTMHPLLQPTVREPSNSPWLYAGSPAAGLLDSAVKAKKKSKFSRWTPPHEAYLALADAVYRPRVTLNSPPPDNTYSPKDNRCTLTIAVPFFLPGISKLHIEFEEKADSKGVVLMRPLPEGLKVGPGAYELVREYPYHQTTTCTASARLDLFGHGEVQLPHDPLFCKSDIETRIDDNTSKGVQSPTKNKWIVAEKIIAARHLRATPGDIVGGLLNDLKEPIFRKNQPGPNK